MDNTYFIFNGFNYPTEICQYDVTSVINDGWYMLLGLVLANLLGIMISHIREFFQSINQLVLHEMG